MSQKDLILKHLKKSTISSFGAYSQYGITQLATRISELKDRGHNIISIPTTKNGKHFVNYKLVA